MPDYGVRLDDPPTSVVGGEVSIYAVKGSDADTSRLELRTSAKGP